MRLRTKRQETFFFLDVLHEGRPFFVSLRRIKQYMAYAEEGEWEEATETDLPAVLLVCDSPALQKRLHKRGPHLLDERMVDDDELRYYTTVPGEPGRNLRWHDLADPEEPARPLEKLA